MVGRRFAIWIEAGEGRGHRHLVDNSRDSPYMPQHPADGGRPDNAESIIEKAKS